MLEINQEMSMYVEIGIEKVGIIYIYLYISLFVLYYMGINLPIKLHSETLNPADELSEHMIATRHEVTFFFEAN